MTGWSIKGIKNLAGRREGRIRQASLSPSPEAACGLGWTVTILCSLAECSGNEVTPLFSSMISFPGSLLLLASYPGIPSVMEITLLRSCHLCYSMTPREAKVILLKKKNSFGFKSTVNSSQF